MKVNGDLAKWMVMADLLRKIHMHILEILNLIRSMDMVGFILFV